MALAGSEQDGYVSRLRGSSDARDLVADDGPGEEPHRFICHRFSGCRNSVADDKSEGRFRRDTGGRSRVNVQREPVVLAEPELVTASRGRLLDRRNRAEHIVNEGQERRCSPKTDRDGLANVPLRAQTGNERRGFVHEPCFGIAKSVNRLFSIANDEDGGRQRVARCARALAPAPDKLGDQIPLGSTRVLKLVHQHVMVSGLQSVAAARELIHLAQQVDRALEHAGEIEKSPGVQCAAVL